MANFGKHGDVTAYNQEKYNLVQSFGTTAVRDTCPRVDRSFSFASRANSYSDRLVGPGSYNTNLMSDFTKKQQKTLRPTPVGFNGTAERPCLRKSDSRKSLSAPGPSPAQYNPDYFTLAHSAEKAAMSSRKIGVFGTTGPRFRPKNGIEAEAERTELNVGPGSYEHEPVVERVIVQHHKQFVSNFKPQHRYVEGEEINKGGKGFVLLGSQAAKKDSVMSYRDMPHEVSRKGNCCTIYCYVILTLRTGFERSKQIQRLQHEGRRHSGETQESREAFVRFLGEEGGAGREHRWQQVQGHARAAVSLEDK